MVVQSSCKQTARVWTPRPAVSYNNTSIYLQYVYLCLVLSLALCYMSLIGMFAERWGWDLRSAELQPTSPTLLPSQLSHFIVLSLSLGCPASYGEEVFQIKNNNIMIKKKREEKQVLSLSSLSFLCRFSWDCVGRRGHFVPVWFPTLHKYANLIGMLLLLVMWWLNTSGSPLCSVTGRRWSVSLLRGACVFCRWRGGFGKRQQAQR